mmetsp:Transcript_34651/g.38307  ORF Transcript_34651/g.38307 Transcript_34651/m.38307 type:complete len:145 (+) Transcript_34651:59-493(+)
MNMKMENKQQKYLEYQLGGRAFNTTSSSLLPHQAQEKMQHSPEFREAVLSFRGQSSCLIERAIELDHINQIQNEQNNKNNNHDQPCAKDDTGRQPLLPHQAQERMQHSPLFRKAVLSFKGQNNCLVERAIEFDYITRVRNCLLK